VNIEVVVGICCVILGWFLGSFSGPLTHLATIWILGPRLKLEFTQGDDCVTLTPEEYVEGFLTTSASTSRSTTTVMSSGSPWLRSELKPVEQTRHDALIPARKRRVVFYARERVTNEKPRIAQKCQAWLVRVEEMNKDGEFKETAFKDSGPMIWAYHSEIEAVDIPQGINRYVDIVRIQQHVPGLEPRLRPHSGEVRRVVRHDPIFNKSGTFRFTILVSAQDVRLKESNVIITRDETWPPKAKLDSKLTQSGRTESTNGLTAAVSRRVA
jgi:hypothetical protein